MECTWNFQFCRRCRAPALSLTGVMAPQTPMGSCRVKQTKFSSARQESKREQNSQNPHFYRKCVRQLHTDRLETELNPCWTKNTVCSSWLMSLEHPRWVKIGVQILCQLESQTPLTVTQEPFKTRVQFFLQTPCVEAEGRITLYCTEEQTNFIHIVFY